MVDPWSSFRGWITSSSAILVGVELGGKAEGDIHQKGCCFTPVAESIGWRSSRLCGRPWRKRSMYFARIESCRTSGSEKTVDFLALAGCLNVSMLDEFVVLTEDPKSVEDQVSAKSGFPCVAVKQWSRLGSCWLFGLRVCSCGPDCWFERTGLKVVFLSFFDRDWLLDGW